MTKIIYDIGLDARMIRHTGIGTYVRGLTGGIRHLGLEKKFQTALFGNPETVRQDYREFCFSEFTPPIYSIAEQLKYPGCLAQCRLWHSPHYNIPILKSKTKLIVTIHDIIHWIFRKQFFSPLKAFYAEKMLKLALDRADHVISVSQNTKLDLVNYFHANPEKISVIYEGVDPRFRKMDSDRIHEILKSYAVARPYFLYVGLIKPHKGIDRLLRIYRDLRAKGKINADLVLVGKKDQSYPKGYEVLQDLKSGNGVIYLEGIYDEAIVALYSGALALVHPSRYEGFGLTLLESMACETPVLACRATSIPEVTGDAAYLVHPDQDHELEEGLVRLENDPALRQALAAKGVAQAAKFRWDETARQTVAIYQKILATS